MKVGFGTLGWHVEYLKPLIDEGGGLEKIVFYYGYVDKEDFKEKTLRAKKQMVELCESFEGLKYVPTQLKNIFDFKSIVRKMRSDIELELKAGNEVVLFDIAGGTKIMVAAALMVSLFKGIPALYYDEESRQAVRLPLLGMKYISGLTPREREIVKFVIDYKGQAELTQTTLAKLLDVEKGTINPQVLKLVGKGVLELVPSKDHRSKVVKAVDGIELLLE